MRRSSNNVEPEEETESGSEIGSESESEIEIESESDELEENTNGIGKRKTTEFTKTQTTKKQKLLINNKEKVQCDEQSDSSLDDSSESDHNRFSLIMEDESDDESDDESVDEEVRIGIIGYSRILEFVTRKNKRGNIPFNDDSERQYYHNFLNKQKKNRADGKLNRKQIDSINALNLNVWYKSDDDWDAKYNEMVKFYRKKGRFDSPSLTEWAQEQRTQRSENPEKVSLDRIEALQRMPRWDWDVGATAAAKHSPKQTSVSKLRIHFSLYIVLLFLNSNIFSFLFRRFRRRKQPKNRNQRPPTTRPHHRKQNKTNRRIRKYWETEVSVGKQQDQERQATK